ncbi:GntR family transcriptional regulator [Ktedonobacteria bacterium brp13]|nr:GntR family transcriptional regulator [Ktedonobacteria bacterium brp13]
MLGKLHRETLAEQAAAGLMQFILEKNLKPGEMLPSEVMLATEFGVSRQVIREALKSLQGQGVIEIINGKGAIIQPINSNTLLVFFARAVQINPNSMIELIEVRKGIEVQSAMLAAERRTHEELTRMREIVTMMGQHLGNSDTYIELDLELHLAIASATHNTMMYHLIESIREVSKDTIREGLLHRRTTEQLERVQELHAMLLAELERGDADAAGQAMALQFDEAIIALVTDAQAT